MHHTCSLIDGTCITAVRGGAADEHFETQYPKRSGTTAEVAAS